MQIIYLFIAYAVAIAVGSDIAKRCMSSWECRIEVFCFLF